MTGSLAFHEQRMMADSLPAIIRSLHRAALQIAMRVSVAVGASPGARTVVLHGAVPAGFRTSRCWDAVADRKGKGDGQNDFGQHVPSPLRV